jgi:hypothetical protein
LSRRILNLVDVPAAFRSNADLHSRSCPGGERPGTFAVGAQQQQAPARDQVHETPERQRYRLDVGVNVGVIELDVVDDADVREVLEELRSLVEECAVVLIPFDDEVAAVAEPVARTACAQIPGDAADEDARIGAGVREDPSRQRGRGRLAVRSCDDDGPRAPEKVIADGFGQRAVGDLSIQDFLELRITAGDGVADDDEVEVAGDVLGAVAAPCFDAFGEQEIAHRRIDVLVRALNVAAFPLEHRRQGRGGGTADTDHVNPAGSASPFRLAIQRPPHR